MEKTPNSVEAPKAQRKSEHTTPDHQPDPSLLNTEPAPNPPIEIESLDPDRGKKFGINNETCSAEELGLSRFTSPQKIFAGDKKSSAEKILNPFGDPWSTRKPLKNPFIPTMTSSSIAFTKRERGEAANPLHDNPEQSTKGNAHYKRYADNALSDYHYDETLARLAPEMSLFKSVKKQFHQAGIEKKFIGYTVLNYNDHHLFPKNTDLPEWFYVHKPGDSTKPEDRLHFKDGSTLIASGEVFDIRNPRVRDALCKAVREAMETNGVDGVLVDYAVRRYAFGAPGLIFDLPGSWFTEFQENQHQLIRQLYHELNQCGKKLYLNGVMLDSITVTKPELINLFIKYCDGMMWEQPFRWEWRDYNNDEDDYYNRLEKFFDLAAFYKRRLIVKIGSYRYHATEDIDPSWNTRFTNTDYGVERHLAKYNTCFFLLFYNRHFSRLLYTHPTELWDIFTSEAYFRFWDINIGESLGPRLEYSRHVHLREFQNAVVFVNNTLEPVTISPRNRPEGLQGALPSLNLEPLSGEIWVRPLSRLVQSCKDFGSIMQPRRRLKALLGKSAD